MKEYKDITWDDLIPEAKPISDPFKDMDYEILKEIKSLVLLNDAKSRRDLSTEESKRKKELETSIEKKNINFDSLMVIRSQIIEQRESASIAIVEDLLNTKVAITGFVLPLEIKGTTTDEFLLVPWVGACIHTPPPASNQIIYIKLKQPITINGMYDASKIKGILRSDQKNNSVFMMDGNGDVGSSYTIDNVTAEVIDLMAE